MADAPPHGVPFGPANDQALRLLRLGCGTMLFLLCLGIAAGLGALAERGRPPAVTDAAWSGDWVLGGDDRTVVFVTGHHQNVDLYACDLQSRQCRLLAAKQGDVEDLALSPDAHTVAYVKPERDGLSLVRQPVAGGAPLRTPLTAVDAAYWPSWSPEGDAVYVVGSHANGENGDETDTVWRVDAATGKATSVSTPDHALGGFGVQRSGAYRGWLRLEPEEAEASGAKKDEPPRVVVLNPKTGETVSVDPVRLPADVTEDGGFVLHQEPDFEAMKTRRWRPDDPAPMRLWVATADGKPATTVWRPDSTEVDHARPTSDGKAILTRHTDDDSDNWWLRRVNPADGSSTVLFDAELLRHPTTWSGPSPLPAGTP